MKEETVALSLTSTSLEASRKPWWPPLVLGVLMAMGLAFPFLTSWASGGFKSLFQTVKGPVPVDQRVTLVEIDDATLAEHGPLPWERKQVAQLVDAILEGGPRVLGIAPELLSAAGDSRDGGADQLAKIFVHQPVVLAAEAWAESREGSDRLLSSLLKRNDILEARGDISFPAMGHLELPERKYWTAGVTVGISKWHGIAQEESIPALTHYKGVRIPNFALEMVRRALEIPTTGIRPLEGIGLLMGQQGVIPLTQNGRMLLQFSPSRAFPRLSAGELLGGTRRNTDFQERFVFLGLDNGGSKARSTSGRDKVRSQTEFWATAASNILSGQLLNKPAWSEPASRILTFIFAAALLGLYFLGLSAWAISGIGVLLALFYPFLSLVLLLTSNWWLPPEVPFFTTLFGALGLALSMMITSEQDEDSDGEREEVSSRRRGPSPKEIYSHSSTTGGTITTAIHPQNKGNGTGPAHPRTGDNQPRNIPLSQPRGGSSQAFGALAGAHPDVERDASGALIRLGKYRMMRRLASGAAGDVYESFDTQVDRKVAIKTLTRDAGLHFDRVQERFLLEAKAAGALNHSNINTIFDFGTIHNVSFMVLEFLDGVTLAQWMKRNPVPEPQMVLPWIEQVSDALDYAHDHHIIHRDLKPANLMIVDNGRKIKLLDFGIAKMDDVMLTQTGMTVGTPSYMSPEQLTGAPVGPNSDQYGLAVVVYQLLSHHLPVRATKIPELCRKVLKGELIPITEVNPNVPDALWEVLKTGMAKDPEHRFPSCRAFYEALALSVQGVRQ